MMGVFIFRQQATETMPTGKVSVRMEFAADSAQPATGGEVTLFVNDDPWRAGAWITLCRFASPPTPRWTSGATTAASSTGSTSSRKPFPFNGTVRKVVFDIKPHPKPDEAELHAVASRTAAGHALSE